jgi:hypothetical protein
MVNSFIRPSDLRVLKFKHLQLRKDGRESWYALNHPATKTNANEVQAMPATVGIINNLLKDKKNRKEPCSNENYVFMPTYTNRDTAMAIIARQFRKVLERTGMGEGTGKTLTLYSLRHTSIMLRLIKGNVDTLVLARNARTSQQMIDQFYAQHLTTDQVRRQLHAFIKKEVVRKKTEKRDLIGSKKKSEKSTTDLPTKTQKTRSNTKKSSTKPVRKRVE